MKKSNKLRMVRVQKIRKLSSECNGIMEVQNEKNDNSIINKPKSNTHYLLMAYFFHFTQNHAQVFSIQKVDNLLSFTFNHKQPYFPSICFTQCRHSYMIFEVWKVQCITKIAQFSKTKKRINMQFCHPFHIQQKEKHQKQQFSISNHEIFDPHLLISYLLLIYPRPTNILSFLDDSFLIQTVSPFTHIPSKKLPIPLEVYLQQKCSYTQYILYLKKMNKLLTILLLSSLLSLSLEQHTQCTTNTFKTQGNGQVFIPSDIVRISIVTTGNGTTAAIALINNNRQVTTLNTIFKGVGIPLANYSTASITIYQTYNYSSNPAKLIGSTATQTTDLIVTPATLALLLKSLGALTVTIQSISFDLLDKTNAIKKARAAAFFDARNKFTQYLSLTGLKNDGLVKFYDLNSEVYTPFQSNAYIYELSTKLKSPPGPVQVMASIAVTWRVKS